MTTSVHRSKILGHRALPREYQVLLHKRDSMADILMKENEAWLLKNV